MTLDIDEIKKLQEFNRAAIEMFSLSFVEKTSKINCTINWNKEKGFSGSYNGPNDESIKALCNDLRKFIQKNDELKIEKLFPIYKGKGILTEEKEIYNKTISEYEKYKKSFSKIEYNGKKYTNGEFLDIFLYGKYSHRSKNIKDEHDNLEKFEPIYNLYKFIFVNIVFTYLNVIDNLVYSNNLILERLGYKKIIKEETK